MAHIGREVLERTSQAEIDMACDGMTIELQPSPRPIT